MAVRHSIMHPRLEELGALSPASSPLRRRSSIVRVTEPTDTAENDDESERLQRRLKKNQPQAGEPEKRRSLGLGFVSQMSNPQIADGVSHCIKLSAENKINVKNAFSLEMIDFMTYMIKKSDGNMSNLQVASTSLDVSTKIYGFRVDGVHTDILKMIGGLDKQEKRDSRQDNAGGTEDMDDGGDKDVEGEPTQRAKKKKKSKHKILASTESLRAPLDIINPASMMFGESDSQTTDMLYQAILPLHATSDLYLHPYDDVILDTVNPEVEAPVNNALVNCPRLKRFGHLDLCPSFANFEFLGWSAEEELNLTPEENTTQVENNGFQFNMDADFPVDDEPGPSGMNYYDIEDDDHENVEPCHRAGPAPAMIVDFSEVVKSARQNKNFEYSYLQDNMNIQSVGASHWKIRFPTKNLGGSRIVEGCGQEPIKRRKDTVVAFSEESSEACMAKFDIAKKKLVKLQTKTAKVGWSEEKLTLPPDVDYDDLQCCRYYLRPDVIKKFPHKNDMNGTLLPDEVGNYDYSNDNDTTDYCPNIMSEDHQPDNEDIGINGADVEEIAGVPTQAFTGDNLVEAPKMTNKIFIPFSQRAKKIDMRALKRAIWKDLTSTEGDKENIDGTGATRDDNADKVNGSKNFSDIVKNLPKMLTKSNSEALSVPIAFISLLHLANEKTLQIDSSADKTDLHIRQG